MISPSKIICYFKKLIITSNLLLLKTAYNISNKNFKPSIPNNLLKINETINNMHIVFANFITSKLLYNKIYFKSKNISEMLVNIIYIMQFEC